MNPEQPVESAWEVLSLELDKGTSQCWAKLARALDEAENRRDQAEIKESEDVSVSASIPSKLYLLIPFIAALPFFLSSTYSEWYIDELFAITRNEDARGETPIWRVFLHDFWGNNLFNGWTHKSYRPLVTLSYWFQFHLNGYVFRPQPLRVANSFLNALVGGQLWFFLRKILKFPGFHAAVATALFLCHPVHVENVVYLVGRADVMAASFWLWGIWAYWRASLEGSWKYFTWSMILGIASGLCKEPGFLVYGIYVVIEVLLYGELRPQRNFRSFLVRVSLVTGIFLVAYTARSLLVGGVHVEFSYVDTPIPYQKELLARTLSFAHLHWQYFRLLFLPWHLSWDYSFDAVPIVAAWTDVRVLGMWSTYLAIFSGISEGLRRLDKSILEHAGHRSSLILGIALALLPFLPASNLLFTVGTVIGERLLYISSIGWAVVVASLMTSRKRCLIAIILLCLNFYNCTHRVHIWRSRVSLFGEDAKHFSRSAKTLHQFATVLHKTGHLSEALQLYESSLSVFDDNALTDYCIAQIHAERDEFEKAYSRFVKIANGHGIGFGGFNRFLFLVDFGYTCVALGRYDEAIPLLQEGLDLNLDVPHALNAMAVAKVRLAEQADSSKAYMSLLQEAVHTLETGLRYDPGNIWIWNNLAGVLLMGREVKGAVNASSRALMIGLSYGGAPESVMRNARIALATGEGFSSTPETPAVELFFHRML